MERLFAVRKLEVMLEKNSTRIASARSDLSLSSRAAVERHAAPARSGEGGDRGDITSFINFHSQAGSFLRRR
jgi:hypothetical protein